jgi:hypothetical protein
MAGQSFSTHSTATPPWMYASAPRASVALPAPQLQPAPLPAQESLLNAAFDWGSKGADLTESIFEQGVRNATHALGSQWNSVDEMSDLLARGESLTKYAGYAKVAGGALSLGEIATAQDPMRAAIKEGFTLVGKGISAQLGPIGATVGGELIGGTYDKLFFEDMPALRQAGAGLATEAGTLADITRERLQGDWSQRVGVIDDISDQIARVGDGQGFVRENLADGLALGYRGAATVGAGVAYAGETVAGWGSDLADWVYQRGPEGGELFGGALEMGPDDWHGCGGPNTGWIVPDEVGPIDLRDPCQGHDDAWLPGASLNDLTRANVQLGMDIIQGGSEDQSWAETAGRAALGFGYTFATDAVALGSSAWGGVSSWWDSGTSGAETSPNFTEYASPTGSSFHADDFGSSDSFFEPSGSFDLFNNSDSGYETF